MTDLDDRTTDRSRPERRPRAQATKPLEMPADRWHDMELVTRMRAGNQNAFSELYETYHRNVFRYILPRVNSRRDAEDLTQETFIQAFRSIANFEGRSRLLTWILGVARYTCMRFYRLATRWMVGTTRIGLTPEPTFDARIEQRVDALVTLDHCDSLLDRLRSEDEQAIFRLRYYEQKSVREISAAVGKSVHAVKTSLWRSRRTLREALPEFDEIAA